MRVRMKQPRAAVAGALIATLAIPALAWAGVSEPDGEVKVRGKPFKGLGTINTSGDRQTATATRKQGDTAVFVFRYHNTEVGVDDFLIGGCPPEGPLRVRYFTGGAYRTAAVNAGTLEFEDVAGGEVTPKVRAEVKVRRRAPDGFAREVCVPVLAQNQNVRDEPGWKIKVK
jgi:hypothetical protein